MPKKAQNHVSKVDSKIQNTDGMEELENVLVLIIFFRGLVKKFPVRNGNVQFAHSLRVLSLLWLNRQFNV